MVLVLAFLGCSEFELEKVVEEEEGGFRALKADPGSVEFGLVADNRTVTETVTLLSTGTLPVTISGLAMTGASAFSVTWPAGTEEVLDPGERLEVVVSYAPESYEDVGGMLVMSDAPEEISVPLSGAGAYPALLVAPAALSFETIHLQAISEDVVVTSVGTADLVLSSAMIDGGNFTWDGDVPATLPPGDSITLTVTYQPLVESETSSGFLWLTSNTRQGVTAVPLYGRDGSACIGLGEAWERGMLTAAMAGFGGSLVVENHAEQQQVCIDHCYVWLSDDSQDLGAGDMSGAIGDPSSYPLGSLTLDAGTTLNFMSAPSSGPAWWCMEETQYTDRNHQYTFSGARVPEPLLTYMLAQDQDAVWEWMDENPVMIEGRDTNWVEMPTSGGTETVDLRVINMGGWAGDVEIRETLPAGWTGTDFSVDPDRLETGTDGATVYVWDATLEAREQTDLDTQTHYDEQPIRYTLHVPSCGRTETLVPMETRWTDTSGEHRVDTANPMIVTCE